MTIAMRRIAGAFIAVLLAVGALTMFTTGSASAYSAGCQTEDAAVVAAKAQYNRDYKPAKRALVQLTRAKKAAHRHHTAAAKKRVKKAQRKFNRALRTVKRDVNRYNVAYGTAFACHNQASGSAYVDLRAAFKGPDYSYDETHYLSDDGDHPNAAGHQQIATAAVDVLASALWP